MSQVIIGIGALLIAGIATMVNYALFRSQVDPKVVVYVADDPDSRTVILLVVENVGKGVARDVRFSSDRPIPASAFGMKGLEGEPKTLNEPAISQGIPALGPGSRRAFAWGQFGGLREAIGDRPIMVTVSYWRDATWPFGPRGFEESYPLEVESFEGTDAGEHWGARIASSAEEAVRLLRNSHDSSGYKVKIVGGHLGIDSDRDRP